MKNKRREYTAQFYKKNHIAFAAALLSSLLTSALNLYIAWVLQQMIDAVSGVPGSFALSALLWFVLSVIAAIILLKTASYFSKPCFMEKAMKQYKNYAFCMLTRKSISPLVLKIPRITYLRSPMMRQRLKTAIWMRNSIFCSRLSCCSALSS